MKKLLAALMFMSSVSYGAEVLTLDSTYYYRPAITADQFYVGGLNLNWIDKEITIVLASDVNAWTATKTVKYEGALAESLMILLNKADLSSNSLQRRIIQRLIDDGYVQGTISGTPD